MNIFAIIYLVSSLMVKGGKTFDAGYIKEGVPIVHTFKLVNTGKDTVFILEVRRTCGCTTTETSGRVVPPGDTFYLKAKVSSDGYYGKISKPIYVFYREQNGEREYVKLRINATIYKNSEKPKNVYFSLRWSIVFDIRDKASYSRCHIAGSEHIDARSLISLFEKGKISLDRETYIYIVSPDTIKGMRVIKVLRKAGYEHAYYVEGGIEKWIKEVGKKGLICSK